MSSNAQGNWYERHVLPRLIDVACGIEPIRCQRRSVIPLARGHVLEIGVGTGLNFEHYDKAHIKSIVGVEPNVRMHAMACKRAAEAKLPVQLLGLSAEAIPLEAKSFDTVVITYSLCTIPNPAAALKEMRRVLKQGGRLIFSEHGRSPDPAVARWQDRLTPLWSRIAGGCHLNRDIPELLRDAGFHLQDMQTQYLPGPRPLTYNYRGTAEAVSTD
jgi:ubiquinone/menaquinone biosynthesis C-methylase UbiE